MPETGHFVTINELAVAEKTNSYVSRVLPLALIDALGPGDSGGLLDHDARSSDCEMWRRTVGLNDRLGAVAG